MTRAGSAIGRRYSARPGIGIDGNADQVAGRREGGLLDRRRIDADLHALAQQIADQPVERLVGAVADIIVIARKQGDAEVARLARRRAVGVSW